MGLEVLFATIGVIIFLGFIGEMVFKKTNIPDVIWLILFGIVISRFFDIRSVTYANDLIPIFTTFALLFILFEGALSIKLKDLFKSMSKTTIITFLSFVLSILVMIAIGAIIGWPLLQSLLIGAIIGGTSSAVVIPISQKLNIKDETESIFKLESSISDVLCILSSITIMGIIIGLDVSVSGTLNSLFGSFAIALLIGAVAGFLWIPLLKYIKEKFTKSYLITIAFLLIVYAFVEFIGANGAIAALAFGIVMGNSKRISSALNHEDTKEVLSSSDKFFYSQISFFVKAFFFVFLGMMIDFSNPFPFIVAGVITLALFFIRPLAIAPVAGKFEERDRAALETLIPKGLAAAVLAQLVEIRFAEAGMSIFEGFGSMIMAVVLFSIVLSSILVFLVERGWFLGFPHMGRRIFKLDGLGKPTKPSVASVQKVKPVSVKPATDKVLVKKKKRIEIEYKKDK